MMNSREIRFKILTEGVLFSGNYEGKTVVFCKCEASELDFFIQYDFHEVPLHLIGKGQIGDSVKIILLPYRIELYINDILMDEEWPFGNDYLDQCEITDHGCELSISDGIYEKKEEPSVLGTFTNAEGWKPEENVFVGDCMPYTHDGVYHVLYLKDRHHHKSKWRKGAHQWSHISTKDFVTWEIHPMAIEVDDPKEGSICTGSWCYHNNKHYLYYTVRMCDGSPATICRSISEDGYHFEKDRSFSFVISDKYTAATARDPKIVKGEDGLFHMILTTFIAESMLGCLVHLTSKDLDVWEELEEPLYVAPEGMGEPECPDYFQQDGYYYLVYSLKGKGYYQYSKKPFSDWIVPKNPLIPCKRVPKAALWNDKLVFAGFEVEDGSYAGTLTFLEAEVGENGELIYHV